MLNPGTMAEGDRAAHTFTATCTGSLPVYNGVVFLEEMSPERKNERKKEKSKMSLIIYCKSRESQ